MLRKKLIGIEDVKPSRPDFEVVGAFNPGVAVLGEETLLLVRVAERVRQEDSDLVRVPVLEDGRVGIRTFRKSDPDCDCSDPRVIRTREGTFLTSRSHFRLARSSDGEHFTVADQPTLEGEGPAEAFGIEDARITQIGADSFVTYSSASPYGIVTGICRTRDFVSFERMGHPFCPDNKDVVIFPERRGAVFPVLHRPSASAFGPLAVWLAESPDLCHFGNNRFLFGPREGYFDDKRVGAGCPPIRWGEDWLLLYHGADRGDRYALAAAVLDGRTLEVKRRSRTPLMEPEEEFEKNGFFSSVVFVTGCHPIPGGVRVFYGGADQNVCCADLSFDEIRENLKKGE